MIKLFVGNLAVNKWVICSQSKANAFLKAHNVMNVPWMCQNQVCVLYANWHDWKFKISDHITYM